MAMLAAGLHAQTFTATVKGRVVDPSGGVIPRAKLAIRNVATNWEQTTTSGAEGNFVLALLPPGEYALSVDAEGFKKEVRSGIVLQVGQTASLDVPLAVGDLVEVVNVAGDVPVLQSETAALGGVVEQRQVIGLPLNFRSFLSLAQLQPNVFLPAQGSQLGFRGGFNVAGNSEVANNFLLDGIDNLDPTGNQTNHIPVLDAVREFRVLTGVYAAEYGRQSGGQVIVTTKSGSNEFHGSAYEFHRTDNLDARNFFAPEKSELKRNQFGGTLGGPIRRDKAFFFASYGGLRAGAQRAAVAAVPTLKMRNGDFSELLAAGSPCPATGVAPVGPAGQSTCIRNPRTGANYPGNMIPQRDWHAAGKGLLDLYPTSGLRPGLVNNLPVAVVETSRLDQFSARLDYRFGDKTALFGSYSFSDKTDLAPILNPLCGARRVPGYGCDELQRTQHLALVLTQSFSPRVLLEARVGYNRNGFFRLQEDRDQDVVRRLGIGGLPDVGVTPLNQGAPSVRPTGFDFFGGNINLPQGRHDNTYHYVANLTYIRGTHTFKGGADMRRFLFNSFVTQFGRGEFRFNGRYTRHSIADLLLGLPSRAERNPGAPFHNAMDFSSGFYFQDDWKVTPSFTLNWGIRYELNLPPVERVNKMASFDPATNTLRVAGGREALPIIDTSVPGLFLKIRPRSDVGRRLWSTDKNNWAPRLGFAWKPLGSQRWVLRGGYGVYYNLQNIGNAMGRLSRGLPFRLRQRFDNTSVFSASTFTLTDAFPAAIAGNTLAPPAIDPHFRTAYMQQWSLGVQRELFKDLGVDVSYLGSKGTKLPQFVNWNQCAARCSGRPFPDWADIESRISVATSNYHSLQVRVEKRFNQGFGVLSSYTWSKSIDTAPGITSLSDASNGSPQDSRNPRNERGRSDFDVTHRYVLSYLYELPIGAGRHWFRNAHGLTDALLGGWELTGILTLQTGSPFSVVVDTSTDASGTFGFADRPNLVGDPYAPGPHCARPKTPECWFNPDAFAIPSGSFGNFGRNALVGPTLRNFNLGVFKNFRFGELRHLQFRAEFFNLTNHPNFGLPNRVLGGAGLGAITLAASGDNTGAERQIQLGLKWTF